VRRSLVLVVLAAVTALGWAPAASADSIWVQSYQRSSQTEECTHVPGETPWQASWGADSSWHPSYENWANAGRGGWTCTRSITWARDSTSGDPYAVGSIGPGGGLVFLIQGGVHYEMAPRTWHGGADDPALEWCQSFVNVPGATGAAVGRGSANTAAMAASCGSPSEAAGAVLAYGGTDASVGQWFLPSTDELNALCNYSRNPADPAPSNVACQGLPDADFSVGEFGFGGDSYWESVQVNSRLAYQLFFDGTTSRFSDDKNSVYYVRPIRAF
jgi:hypothetical protein